MNFYNSFEINEQPPNSANQIKEVPERRSGTLRNVWLQSTKSEKSVIILSLGILVFFIAVGLILASENSEDKKFSDSAIVYETTYDGEPVHVCGTAECVIAAADIIQSLDTTVDPCDDFYKFACGGWKEKNPIPDGNAYWGQFGYLRDRLSQSMSKILEEEIVEEDLECVKKSKLLYNSCMDVERIEEVGLDPLIVSINELGGWPMANSSWKSDDYDFDHTIALMKKSYDMDCLVRIHVNPDEMKTNYNILYLDQTSLGMTRSIFIHQEKYEERINAYKSYLKKIVSIIALYNDSNIDETAINKDVENVFNFEVELAKITSSPEDRRNFSRLYNPMMLSEFYNDTDGPIKWPKILQETFDLPNSKKDINNETTIIIREPEYFNQLEALIKTTDIQILANYIGWRFVMTYGPETVKDIRDAYLEYKKISYGVTADIPRWKYCSNQANGLMGMAVGIEYAKRQFSQTTKGEASRMVEDIRLSFAQLLGTNEWLDGKTRMLALEKAQMMTKHIGYPDWFDNKEKVESYLKKVIGIKNNTYFNNVKILSAYWSSDELSRLDEPTDREEWTVPPSTVNANYLAEFNTITFPAAILQPPFYRHNSLQALNYGAIGQVIGHEITHGFDDHGNQYDKNGNAIPWWSNDTLIKFKEKAKCLIDQYSHYQIDSIKDILPNNTINGITTQGENIADNGGLREALYAYHKFIEDNGEEPRLPGLEKYDPFQLFFISNAMVWCQNDSKKKLMNQLLSDPHSPGEFRVKGALQNSKEFSEVWKCKSNDYMNPKNKCLIW